MTNKGLMGYPSVSGGVPDGSITLAKLASPHGYGYLASGNYYYTSSAAAVTTSSNQGTGTLRLVPWVVPNACTLSRIGAEVTTIGDVASLVRLGIYADSGSGLPGALVLDAGTIAGDSATVQEITISLSLTPGLYWIGGAVQNVSVTQPTLRIGTSVPNIVSMPAGTTTPSSNATVTCLTKSGVTGALPGTVTSPSPGVNVVRVFVKVT